MVTGPVRLGVCSCLTVEGVDVILGNDLAGGDVFPRSVENSKPNASDCSKFVLCFAPVFSACPVTYAQMRKFRDVVNLSEIVWDKNCCLCAGCKLSGNPNQKLPVVPLLPTPVIREPFGHLLIDRVGPLPKSKKRCYEKKRVSCRWQPNKVPVLLPKLGKFAGEEKLSDTDYVISTHDR